MTPVGETLRRERVKRNLEIEEISKELKISVRFLQAIEEDRFERLPGGVFVKSFVRQYARYLGLDEEQMAGQVQYALTPLPELSELPERPKPAGFAPIEVPKVADEWQTVGDRGFQWSGWLSAVVFVAVMLVCSALYTWIQHPKFAWPRLSGNAPAQTTQSAPVPPVQTPTTTAVPEAQSAAPATGQPSGEQPVTGQPGAQPQGQPPAPQIPAQTAESRPVEPRPEAPKAVDTKPVAPQPAENSAVTPSGSVPVRVTITADEAVWLLARADGKYAFSATMDPHTTRTVEATKEVTLRLGNAGGVTITLNGKPIGPAGPKGQVRTLQFTSGGFQIVPAKPPAPPVEPPAAARL